MPGSSRTAPNVDSIPQIATRMCRSTPNRASMASSDPAHSAILPRPALTRVSDTFASTYSQMGRSNSAWLCTAPRTSGSGERPVKWSVVALEIPLLCADNLVRHLYEEQIHLNSLDHADARNLTEAFREALGCGIGLRRQPKPESALDVGVQL